ncbi:lysophospholipase L1-like esterase [Clostridium algifaecis]|uniref:Lysophospholipase L1-like esterase n=1 Tax=Clostridium algifaecis TaxID=1472040 RepID=A0ABS4KTR2_9CLOT|nr:SGNH/GDSL hydrolase family protein [Clostridium algifaecis]MBP2033439.1 lysophospholipase L1-like esterase [Clostridium algifaecis]
MKLLCIGDSLTTGFGVFKEDSWLSIVENSLKINIINKGVNGDTTSGMLSRSYEDVICEKPSHSFIMGGCNDIMSNRPLEMLEDNLSILVKEALKYNITPIIGIETPIIEKLALIYWNSDSNYMLINDKQKECRKWILNFCDKLNVNYVDFFKLFSDELKNTSPEKLFIDGVHPSLTGHKLMADLVINNSKKLFNF